MAQIVSLFGPPASGKGTQADFMVGDGFIHFSPGKYLREQVAAGDPVCLPAKPYMDAGNIAPDTIVIPIIEKMITDQLDSGCMKLVLDGCPRTLNQAVAIDALLAQSGLKMTVISLVTPRHILEDRRAARVAETLAAGKPPRSDDDPHVFQHRQDVYAQETAPIASYYAARGQLAEIDGVGAPAQVYQRVKFILNPPRPPVPAPGP